MSDAWAPGGAMLYIALALACALVFIREVVLTKLAEKRRERIRRDSERYLYHTPPKKEEHHL